MRADSASTAASDSMLGVYVSVPFCRAKCSFCNFASGVGTAGSIEAYVARLCAEIEAVGATAARLGAELPRRVDTLYLGGGTPSLLTPAQLKAIFAALRGVFAVEAAAEVTLEAAPGQIAGDVLETALRMGVNRVSLGVQSFVDAESAAVGRLHTARACVAEVRRLRAAGVARVGVDLIAGLPGQSAESWELSLDALEALVREGMVDHASVYMLEVDEDSRLGREVLAGGQRFHAHGVPAEEIAAELYARACMRLPAMGLAQYEISNFAAAGRVSRHNLKYWQRRPYVGFGLDAHSMLRVGEGAVRWANGDTLAEYMVDKDAGAFGGLRTGFSTTALRVLGRDENSEGITKVDEREAFEETVFLGLRMSEGVSLAGLRREWVREFEASARELVQAGLMTESEGRWGLTLGGRLVSNEVFGRLLETVAV